MGGSLSELYRCTTVFPLEETSRSTFPLIYHVLTMLISALFKLCSLNRYFFIIIEYLLLRPNIKIHAD